MSDEKKADAEKLDKILSHLDSSATKIDAMSKRMDAMEASYSDGMKKFDAACAKMDADEKCKADAAKADAEKEEAKKADAKKADAAKADAAKVDAAKADAEKEAEDKKKADAAKADEAKKADAARADSDTRRMIEDLAKRIPIEISDADRAQFVTVQMKADPVYQAFGDGSAPRFVSGESLTDYQRRLLTKYKGHSKHWKDVDLAKADSAVLGVAEAQIYADAMLAAAAPSSVPVGTLREIVDTDRTGRRISKFIGDAEACWSPFKQPLRNVIGMKTNHATH
jgi:hypothetical protein